MNSTRSYFKGGFKLLSFSFISSVSGFGVLLFAIKLLGFDGYGKFAGAMSLFLFCEKILKLEVKILLLKYDPEINREFYRGVFSFLLFGSLFISAAILISIIWLKSLLIGYQQFFAPLCMLVILLPVNVSTEVPRAVLEYKAKFNLIASQELSSSLANHSLVLIMLLINPHVFALIAGYYAYSICIAILSWNTSGFFPSIEFEKKVFKQIINYGKHIIIQNSTIESKKLVNPVVVGYMFGAVGVGIISFAEKIVESLRFYQNVLKRVSSVWMGKIEVEGDRIVSFMKNGVLLQILPLGSILLTISFVLYGVSMVFAGEEWRWVNYLYPFLAIDFLLQLLVVVPVIAIQMHLNISDLTKFQVINSSIFAVLSIPMLHFFGLIGYGVALLGSTPSYLLLIRSIQRKKGYILDEDIIVFTISICVALCWFYIEYLSLISLLGVFLFPSLFRRYSIIWNHYFMR